MADATTYFGSAVPAIYPNGNPIIVNGRPLLIPENFSLQKQVDAARFRAANGPMSVLDWFLEHFPPGSSGDPQRQPGWSGGFDARFTDAGNYGYGLSAAAAGISLDHILGVASLVNRIGTGKPLPAVNERAIRQGYDDFNAHRFPNVDEAAGQKYADRVSESDRANALSVGPKMLWDAAAGPAEFVYNHLFNSHANQTDVQRYALKKWGDLDSPDAQATMADFQQAFGGYPQHLDLICCSRCRQMAVSRAAKMFRCSLDAMARSWCMPVRLRQAEAAHCAASMDWMAGRMAVEARG